MFAQSAWLAKPSSCRFSQTVLLVSCQLDTGYSHLGGGTSTEKMPPSEWPVGNSVEHFLNSWLMWVGPVHGG